jgi:hypothetical protein
MIKNILVLCFFCVFFSGTAFCQDEIEIDSQVISINPDGGYIIIKAGEADGVEIGDGLIVHRSGEKIAEAQVIEARAEVSAAQILNASDEIKEGDGILIVKKTKKPVAIKVVKKEKTYKKPALKKEKNLREPKKSKWATLLGSAAEVSSTAPVMAVGSVSRSGDVQQANQESSVVRADINADPSTVFSYVLIVLRENGYSVVLSSRTTGVILCVKPLELSLMKELWADAHARIGHRLAVSIEIKNNNGVSELSAYGFREHFQKGKQIRFSVTKDTMYSDKSNSECYNDIEGLISKIKERVVGK